LWFILETEENPFITEVVWKENTMKHLWHSKVLARFQHKRAIDFILKHISLSNSGQTFTVKLISDIVENIQSKVSYTKPNGIESFKIAARRRISINEYQKNLQQLHREAVIQSYATTIEYAREKKRLENGVRKLSRVEKNKNLAIATFLGEPRYMRDTENFSTATQRWLMAIESVCTHNQLSKLRKKLGLTLPSSLNDGDIEIKSAEELTAEIERRRISRREIREKYKHEIEGVTINTCRKIAWV
jgi:hypothetical protein